jgi:hypothetical protein
MKEKQILLKYFPEGAVESIFRLIKSKNLHVKISKNRKTKLGDYRPPIRHTNHRISINYNLNPYAFLITFLHEFAHLLVYEEFRNRVSPHGKEWKKKYRILIENFLGMDIFPDEIADILEKSIQNSRASSSSDLELSRVLEKYNSSEPETKIEDLPDNAIFETANGKRFVKGEKQRIRYKCKCLNNSKLYLFHPLTPIITVSK